MFQWGQSRFATVKEAESAITTYILGVLKGPVPHPNDLTIVVRDSFPGKHERSKYVVRVAVIVEAEK